MCVCVNIIGVFISRVCSRCRTALSRYEKMNLSIKESTTNAIKVIMQGDNWRNIQARQATEVRDAIDPRLCSTPRSHRRRRLESPDVS